MSKKVKKVVYLSDTFVDFNGQKRPVTMCAASIEVDDYGLVCVNDYNVYDEIAVSKILSLGVAIGHINDKTRWTEETGKKIAYNKAINCDLTSPMLVTTRNGFITAELVNAFLDKEMQHFKQDPGTYIAGYDQEKHRKEKKAQQKKEIENLSENLKKLDVKSLSEEDKKTLNAICLKNIAQ